MIWLFILIKLVISKISSKLPLVINKLDWSSLIKAEDILKLWSKLNWSINLILFKSFLNSLTIALSMLSNKLF